ncbi:MAG: ABC transporter permease [Anaerolineales bacterium]
MKTEMQTNAKLKDNLRIILTITGKDILDAIKNKTTISVLVSALFLFLFYMLFPILEQEDVIRLYDAGISTWLPILEDSIPNRIIVEPTQDSLEYNIARRGEAQLGLVLPADFDLQVRLGEPVNLSGYLLNWVSEKQASHLVTEAEAQITGVVDIPITISVERVFMLPESTGTSLSRGIGSILLVVMTGMFLTPNLMLEEKRTRTLDALLVSPASAGQIAAGKALTGYFYGLVGFVFACLFNTSLILQWGLAILAGLCVISFTVMLGLLMGVWIDNRQQLLILANITIFPMLIAVFMSLETELLPAGLVTVCRWLPITVAFDLLRTSFTPQTSLAFVAPRLAEMLLIAIVLLGLVAWKIRQSDRM